MVDDAARQNRLLEAVRKARADYEAQQDAVQEARDRYYATVRALNAAGMPLREVADALGLSHQRVHQMVGEAESANRRRIRKAARAGGVGIIVALMVSGVAYMLRSPDAAITPTRRPTAVASKVEQEHSKTENARRRVRFEIVCAEGRECHKGVSTVYYVRDKNFKIYFHPARS